MRAIGYLRCSTREQATTGHSLDAQRDRIDREADHRGWQLQWVEDPGKSGKTMNRPGIKYALALLEERQADVLVVSKLDRLGRSVAGLADLLKHAEKYGWSLVALDVGVDSTTGAGRMVLHVLGSVAEWERERISERTREGLAVARDKGNVPGRPRGTEIDVARRIVRERFNQMTYNAIAGSLNDDGIPTTTGKQWSPGTVRMVLAQEGVV